MIPCLIHVGQPKTGTTSIQSTLFWGLRDPRFHFVTLDSDFGNRLLLSAFRDLHLLRNSYYFRSTSPTRLVSLTARSRDYLHRSLTGAWRRGAVPVISAEAVWGFTSQEFELLRRFVVDHGFEPRIIGYLRPPADLIETFIQQLTKMGDPRPWAVISQPRLASRFAEVVPCLDAVFGAEAVSLHVFDPDRFPDHSVVRHFSEISGIEIEPVRIRRENDSLSLPAVRFLHTFNVTVGVGPWRRAVVVKRAILKRILQQLRGPRFNLHPDVIASIIGDIEPQLKSVHARLGTPLPLTLIDRNESTGIRNESQLLDYCTESLDWLCRTTGRPLTVRGSRAALTEEVGHRLDQLASRSLTTFSSLVRDTLAVQFRRRWLTYIAPW